MVKVRYYSKLGHTKDIAIAIASGAGVDAVSITDEPKLNEYTDVLILGGAPYADIMSPVLREYAEKIDPKMVGKVVLFTTSNWSRRTVRALKKIFKDKNMLVDDKYFYAHMLHIKGRTEPAKEFGFKFKNK